MAAARRALLTLVCLGLLAVPIGSASSSAAHRPHIVAKPIAFPARRKAEMQAYAKRHYALATWQLRNPKVIVEHITVSSTFSSAFSTFDADVPDAELHELPGTCAHFVIDTDGTIYQLVPLGVMCRHTVGLNWTAIGIEHTGYSDREVLGDRRQMRASLRLTRFLRCRFRIRVRNVIGHAESVRSPYHRERVRSLRDQTHGDMRHASMRAYRKRLRRLGGCRR
jgi:hypothetical protein